MEVEYLWWRSNYDGIHRRVSEWLTAVAVYRNRLSREEMTKGLEGCFPSRIQQKQQSMKCKKTHRNTVRKYLSLIYNDIFRNSSSK